MRTDPIDITVAKAITRKHRSISPPSDAAKLAIGRKQLHSTLMRRPPSPPEERPFANQLQSRLAAVGVPQTREDKAKLAVVKRTLETETFPEPHPDNKRFVNYYTSLQSAHHLAQGKRVIHPEVSNPPVGGVLHLTVETRTGDSTAMEVLDNWDIDYSIRAELGVLDALLGKKMTVHMSEGQLNTDQSFHEAGIRDGDHLKVSIDGVSVEEAVRAYCEGPVQDLLDQQGNIDTTTGSSYYEVFCRSSDKDRRAAGEDIVKVRVQNRLQNETRVKERPSPSPRMRREFVALHDRERVVPTAAKGPELQVHLAQLENSISRKMDSLLAEAATSPTAMPETLARSPRGAIRQSYYGLNSMALQHVPRVAGPTVPIPMPGMSPAQRISGSRR